MKSISQNPACSQIPASEESGELPIAAELEDTVIGLRPVVDLPPSSFGEPSPVDWSNIAKDPRLVDLEAFELHEDGCTCAGCVRTTLRMSNRPELASHVP